MKTKLTNFGPVVVINLERETLRRQQIIESFRDYGVVDYTFLTAYDGKALAGDGYEMSAGEIGCSMSHLMAIDSWYNSDSTSEYLIVCEDDISLEVVDFWRWSWDELILAAPSDFQLLHLSAPPFNESGTLDLRLREISKTDVPLLTTLYVISRSGAKKVLDAHKTNGKIKFDFNDRSNVADHGLLYPVVDRGYYISLLSASPEFKSSIEGHTDQYFYDSVKSVTMRLLQDSKLSIEEIMKI